MTRRLILHVGSPKCGSTYFQRVMIANEKPLAAVGARYPKPPQRHPGNGRLIIDMDSQGIGHLFDKAETVILSHEDLFALGARFASLGDLCAEHDCTPTVLVFLRPFSEFIYGDFSQYMKQNIEDYIAAGAAYDGLGFEEFAVRRRSQITPLAWLKAWQKASPEPLRIAHHKNIRPVAEDLLGAADMEWRIERAASNPSLRVSDCEDIAEAIAAGKSRQCVIDMYKSAHARVGLQDRGRTAERARWLEALFRSQNDSIQETFGFDNRLAA